MTNRARLGEIAVGDGLPVAVAGALNVSPESFYSALRRHRSGRSPARRRGDAEGRRRVPRRRRDVDGPLRPRPDPGGGGGRPPGLGRRADRVQARRDGLGGHQPPRAGPGRSRCRRAHHQRRERLRRGSARGLPRGAGGRRCHPDGVRRRRPARPRFPARPSRSCGRSSRRASGAPARRASIRRRSSSIRASGSSATGACPGTSGTAPSWPAFSRLRDLGHPAVRRRLAQVVHRRDRRRGRPGAPAARLAGRHRRRRARRARTSSAPTTSRRPCRPSRWPRPSRRAARGGEPMWTTFYTFRLRDLIDILVVAVVLYRVFVMFKETRAVQMLIGLGRPPARVVRGAPLRALQHELAPRELLVLLGARPHRAVPAGASPRPLPARPEPDLPGHDAGGPRAAEPRARRRHQGRRRACRPAGSARCSCSSARPRLRNYAELGVPLDAVLSADLLVSLFLPYSPLHDGAAVIRGDRVAAAGLLPAAVAQHPARARHGHAASRRSRPLRGDRRRGRRGVPRRPGASRWPWAGTWRGRWTAMGCGGASSSCSRSPEPADEQAPGGWAPARGWLRK